MVLASRQHLVKSPKLIDNRTICYPQAEEKVSEGEKKFEEISETIKKEVEMLERMLTKEYTNTFINYLQSMANLQAEVMMIMIVLVMIIIIIIMAMKMHAIF